MYKINAAKLKAAIAESELTRIEISKMLGISANSLGRKINGHTEFVLSEVVGLCKILSISKPCEIFLPSVSQICNDSKSAS